MVESLQYVSATPLLIHSQIMEKQTSTSVVCPVCSLFLREGISLKNHLQTHSKEKVIEALLKQDPLNIDGVENNGDFSANSNRDSNSAPTSENRLFPLNRNALSVLPSSTFGEPSSNQVTQTTPTIAYDNSGVQCVNNVQFPTALNSGLIGQQNLANACNATYTYHQFITSDGNIVLIPVYNVGPSSVVLPNNIVANQVVNSCVVVPPNPVQPLTVVNQTLTANNQFSSSVGSDNVSPTTNVRLSETNGTTNFSQSIDDANVSHNGDVNEEKETDEEVANIFDLTLRKQEDKGRTRKLEVEDDKIICPSISLPDDDEASDDSSVDLEGRSKLIPSAAAVSVIRVRSDLNYESDTSPFQVRHNDERDVTAEADCSANSSGHQYSPVAALSSCENVKCNAPSSPQTMAVESNRRESHDASYDNNDYNAITTSSGKNEYDFVISNSDNATHILPDASNVALNCIARRVVNDQYILPNDDILSSNCSFASGSDYNFLGVRHSFRSSASLISSVNKAMFADVEVYTSAKDRAMAQNVPNGVPQSTMKNEELSVIVKGRSTTSCYADNDIETDEVAYENAENVESAGNSRISPFNIQTDESMPPRGELSGQESLSGAENSIWELQMLQRSTNFSIPGTSDNKDVKIGLQSIMKDIGRAKESEIGLVGEADEKEEELTDRNITSSSSGRKCSSITNNSKKVVREFICFFCRTKFDTWKQRQAHIADQHAEEDGLTIETLFGKRLKYKIEDVKEEEAKEDDESTTPDCIICRICNDTFQTSIELLAHLKVFHGIRKRSCVCPTCFVRFASPADYQQHIQKVHPYECMTCGKKFYTRPGYMLHQKRHMKVKPYSCNDCDKSFVTKQKLAEHVNTHTGEYPIKCELCGCQFKRYSNYQQHKKYLHLNQKRKLKDFICDCGEVFHSKVKLLWHQEIHDEKPKQCPFCVERFVHAASLTRHVRKWHNETYLSEWVTKKKMKNLVACPVCNVTYLHSSLQTHMKIHEDVKPYSCTECSRSFRTKWNLQLHKWTHMSRSAKPFKCKLCVKAYVHKTDYDAHIRSHNNSRPYACNVCGRQFIRKYNCIRHMREHKEPRSHKCNVCGKLFSRSYYLTEHEKVHTGEKPHVCHICGKSSATKSNHNKHVKMHNVVRESVNTES